MDIKKLEMFVQMARLKNITNAAQSLGYTQSGASHMLQNLEQELGNIILFTRNRNGLQLTPAGEQLLPLAQDVLYSYNQLQQMAGAISGLETGLLRIGGFTSVMGCWFPTILKNFKDRYPNVKIETMRASYGEIEEWVLSGQVDCGFSRLPVQKGLRAYYLASDPLVAVLPPEHSLTKKETITLQDLEGEVYIRPTGDRFDDVKSILTTAQVHLKYPHIVHDYHEAIFSVANGMGISIVPRMMTQLYIYNVCIQPLAEAPVRRIGLIVRENKGSSPLTDAFVKMTSELFRSNSMF